MITTYADLKQFEVEHPEFLTERNTPYSIIRHSAEKYPDKLAFRYLSGNDPETWQTLSYPDLLRRVHAAAQIFRDAGITTDRSVAILAQHTPTAQIALWGAQCAGRAIPINPMLDADHIVALLQAANARVIVMTGANHEISYAERLVPALRRALPDLHIYSADADWTIEGFDANLEDLLDQQEADQLSFDLQGDCHAVAAFYHTGGTTAAPKLVVHSRLNEAVVAKSCALLHDLKDTDVMLNGFPMFHVAGSFVYGLSVLSVGGTLVIPGRLGMRNQHFMQQLWRHIEEQKITTLGVVPTIMSAILATQPDREVPSLRAALTGGSPLPTELAEAFEARFNVPVRNIFGMTESAGAIALESVNAERVAKSCGFPLPFSQVKIIASVDEDPESSPGLPAGQPGIIAIRGANISSGYSDPRKNAGSFSHGWLISGDIGHLDASNRLFITGRQKDVIIRGAHNIDPQEIEAALIAHPAIAEAAAVGMPDSYAGELPVAFVRASGNAESPDEAELIAYARTRLDDPTSVPKRIFTVDALPLTPVGKIFKPALRKLASESAVHACAHRLSIDPALYSVAVDDQLAVHIEIVAEHLAALKAALTGMPVDIKFTTRGA